MSRPCATASAAPPNLCLDAERVAYLLLNPASAPVLIDVRAVGQVVVEDGLHRIGAAIMRGDELVLVDWSGDVSGFLRTFRSRLPRPQIRRPRQVEVSTTFALLVAFRA